MDWLNRQAHGKWCDSVTVVSFPYFRYCSKSRYILSWQTKNMLQAIIQQHYKHKQTNTHTNTHKNIFVDPIRTLPN